MIFESKGQRSTFLRLSGFTLFQNVFTPLDHRHFRLCKKWRMMIWRYKEHQRSKRLLVKVSNTCFPIDLSDLPFLVNCANISAPYMRFVIKIWWIFFVLEYFLSIPSIIFHIYHPKGEISCNSCNSLKPTYQSFASLNMVQSRQSY